MKRSNGINFSNLVLIRYCKRIEK